MTESPPSPKLVWTPHPVLRIPTREEIEAIIGAIGPEAARTQLARLHAAREEKIKLESIDPLRHGYDALMYERVKALFQTHDEILIMGGNRLGKTRDAIKLIIADQVARPGIQVAAFDRSERASINKQQKMFHAMLPPEWRSLGRMGEDIYVKYSAATGFSNLQYILPNKSQTWFFNYKQDVNDFEGYEIDWAYFDELVPLPFYEAMAFRLGKDRPLKIAITFTPLENGGPAYTPVVQKFLAGSTVVETAPLAPEMHAVLPPDQVLAKGCPPGHLPIMRQCLNPRAAVLYYHWGCNPFGANQEVLQKLQGRPKQQWLVRAYGFVDKPAGAALANYGPAHRLTRERFNELAVHGVTRYCVIDPGHAKNWFIKWYAVTPRGWVILYREWPDFQHYGPWAEPPDRADKHDWRPGEAQRLGLQPGIERYKRLMLELEGWRFDPSVESAPRRLRGERRSHFLDTPRDIDQRLDLWDGSQAEHIARRLIDPRLGGTGVPSQKEGTSIIDLMAEETLDRQGRVLAPRMFIDAAPGRHVQHGIQLLQTAMEYDDSRPLNEYDNCPKWYVVDDLKQSDLCYAEYTGLGTEKDALKDIIDPDRYFIETGLGYMEPQLYQQKRGGYY